MRVREIRHRVSSGLLAVAMAAGVAARADAQAQPSVGSNGFMAVDIFGGYATHRGYGSAEALDEEDRQDFDGWEVGASVRPQPWLGVTASIGRTWQGENRVMHYLAGPRFNTSYAGNYYGFRGFAHVLLGMGSVSAASAQAQSGFELVAGAGLDVWYVARIQFDYLRLPDGVLRASGTPLPVNQVRVMVGGVVPLCFRGCRPHDADGITLSR